MAHIDELLNDTLPDLQVQYTIEGEGAGRKEPENIGKPFEIAGTLTQAVSNIHMTHVWIHESDHAEHWVDEHVHDFDEILIWEGSDPENPRDLGAEIYIEIDGERRTTTTSGSVYVPAGTPHCPLGWNYVHRPFIFHALSLTPEYSTRDEKRLEQTSAE